MKSSKIFKKSEDLYKYIEDLNVIFKTPDQRTGSKLKCTM